MHPEKKIILRKLLFILIFFIYLSQIGLAGEQIVLSSDGTNSNQNQINKALDQATSQAEGITVFLTTGEYEIDGTIVISSDTKLTGDKDAIIKVSSSSSQWFTGSTGIISCKEPVKNVEISGFQINGNCINLDPSMANTPGHDKDCEKLIILHGNSDEYAFNIKIHDMQLYDSFSDGAYIYYAENIECYDNFISNCQHEGIFWSVVLNSKMYNNKIAGICSDCARLDNCINCLVKGNIFFSYNGNNANGAYMHGENGLQVGDAGSSHGYDASNKPTSTKNIEITENTFANNGLEAIILGSNSDNNVYVHDNEVIGQEELETMGIPVDISYTNPPTKEMSERIFSSIFDILDVEFSDTGMTNQTDGDIQYSVQKTEVGRITGGIEIIGFNNTINIDNVSYIPNENSVMVKYAAVKNPDYSWNQTGIKNIEKEVTVKMENGTAKATLNVRMKWYKIKTDETGKSKKVYKTAKAVFNDSEPAPMILERPTELTGIVNQYPTHFMVNVPSEGLTKVVYEYAGNETEHVLMAGEKITNSKGIRLTNFSRVDYWEGDVPHYREFLYVNGAFDPQKLTITAYTPYESFAVENVNLIKNEIPDKVVADWFYSSFGIMVILGYGAWYYLKKLGFL